jgi:hypothetical protein
MALRHLVAVPGRERLPDRNATGTSQTNRQHEDTKTRSDDFFRKKEKLFFVTL